MEGNLPKSFEKELHRLSNRQISAKILSTVELNSPVCIREVAEIVGCSDITARKNLCRLVRANLAVEKRIGKTRLFISRELTNSDNPRGGSR